MLLEADALQTGYVAVLGDAAGSTANGYLLRTVKNKKRY